VEATVIFYKVLGVDGTPFYGGTGRWHLPTADGPGEWMPAIPDPVPCERGYHLCRDVADLLEWLGPTIWVAEAAGEVIAHHNKVVVERARLLRQLPWDERIAREFAADCAERALPVYEAAYPGDDRPRRAVEVARAYARDGATRDQLVAAGMAADAAARAAVRAPADAAEAAANTAVWEAVRAATDAAQAAAWAVARAAAWDAGEAAAPAAAWATDAAALAAVAAADDAAWDAAEAAEAAERRWQATRLAELLGIDPPRVQG